MKILITGGAGFIGYHLTMALHTLGHSVVIYDAFTNYVDERNSRYLPYLQIRLKELKNCSKAFVRGDITDTRRLIDTIHEHQPEVIVNLAAVPIATASNQLAREATSSNLYGIVSLLESIRSTDSVRRFVYVSSSFVYGNFVTDPADEEHPLDPIDVYGGTKLAGEILTKSFGRRFGIEYVIIRPSAVYGPTDANRRVTQVFIEKAFSGEPLTLHDGGEGRVDFTYVDDVVQGFVLATTKPEAANEIFNITRGEGRSMKEFAKILSRHIPNVKTVVTPADEVRPNRGSLSIEKARRILGYAPQYSLEDGMELYINYLKENNLV